MAKPLFIFLVIFSLIYPFSGLSKIEGMAQGPSPTPIGPPESLEELKSMLSRGLGAFPTAFKSALNEALSVWRRIYQWVKGVAGAGWGIKFNSAWERVKTLFFQRSAIFREELEKEKAEMKKEITEIFQKNLWERFKEIIK